MDRTLHITGLVEDESTVSAAAMDAMPSATGDVSAVAPGATGAGVRVADVLAVARPMTAATHCTVISGDGYRASIPLTDLQEGGWLAYSLDGAPLPVDKGGPLRLTVTQGSTLCWNVKGVAELHLAAGREEDDVPANPPH